MCMYVYMHVLCTCVYVCVYVYVYVCMHVYMNVCMNACVLHFLARTKKKGGGGVCRNPTLLIFTIFLSRSVGM